MLLLVQIYLPLPRKRLLPPLESIRATLQARQREKLFLQSRPVYPLAVGATGCRDDSESRPPPARLGTFICNFRRGVFLLLRRIQVVFSKTSKLPERRLGEVEGPVLSPALSVIEGGAQAKSKGLS